MTVRQKKIFGFTCNCGADVVMSLHWGDEGSNAIEFNFGHRGYVDTKFDHGNTKLEGIIDGILYQYKKIFDASSYDCGYPDKPRIYTL